MVRSMFYVKIENDEEDRNPDNLVYTFNEKCYICEDKVTTTGHTEHRIPQSADVKYKTLISNLFWSCARCNDIKGSSFYKHSNECQYTEGYCGIIDCTKCDPNEYISIRIKNDVTMEIEVIEKKYAPCNENTIPLLRKVYGSNEKLNTRRLTSLKENINNELAPLCNKVWSLHFGYINKMPKREIDKRKKAVIDYVSCERPFFAIKLSYIEDMYNKYLNSGFDKILEDILKDPSFHPIMNDCCSHKNSVY